MSREGSLARLWGMFDWILKNRIAAFGRRFNYDTSYMRELLDTDRQAFWALARITKLSTYRRDLPRDVYWAAKLVATVGEDCGPCSQLVVTMALADGADARVLAAALAGDDQQLGEAPALGVRFARASLAHDPAADALREEITRRWGPRAVVSLAFAFASARVYPTVKYALGHGQACQRVVIDGAPVAVTPARLASGAPS